MEMCTRVLEANHTTSRHARLETANLIQQITKLEEELEYRKAHGWLWALSKVGRRRSVDR